MHISAKVDYAVRALVTLAAEGGGPLSGSSLAESQKISPKFLEGILAELRRARLVTSRRGADGGYRLARPAGAITIAEVMRAIDGPLAEVRGQRPEAIAYDATAQPLQIVWIAVRASLRQVLDETTLADVAGGELPAAVRRLAGEPGAWVAR